MKKKSSLLRGLNAIAVAVFCVFAVLVIMITLVSLNAVNAANEKQEEKNEQLRFSNQVMEEVIALQQRLEERNPTGDGHDPDIDSEFKQYILDTAHNELGLVMPNEKIFVDISH